MSISKYETLAKVVELGSLTRAADALGCTQSAVSHTINNLEAELGFSVITRSRAGVKLTADGERIMPSVRGMLNYEEQLRQTASAIRGLDSGTVRIGAFTSVAVHWLPGVIKEFQHDYPNVDLKLLNGDYYDVERWIDEGSVDLGFVNVPTKIKCECIPLMEDRLLAILPHGHKFESYPKFPLVECETEAFITLLEESNHDANRALAAAVFHQGRLRHNRNGRKGTGHIHHARASADRTARRRCCKRACSALKACYRPRNNRNQPQQPGDTQVCRLYR